MRQMNYIQAHNGKADLLLQSVTWRVQGHNNELRIDPTAVYPGHVLPRKSANGRPGVATQHFIYRSMAVMQLDRVADHFCF